MAIGLNLVGVQKWQLILKYFNSFDVVTANAVVHKTPVELVPQHKILDAVKILIPHIMTRVLLAAATSPSRHSQPRMSQALGRSDTRDRVGREHTGHQVLGLGRHPRPVGAREGIKLPKGDILAVAGTDFGDVRAR